MIHLMCIGITSTADEVLFHRNIAVICNNCLDSTKTSSQITTPKNSKLSNLEKVSKAKNQRPITDFARSVSSNDKSEEMMVLLHEIKSSITEHRNETKSYAAVLSEIKDSTNSQNNKIKSSSQPLFSSVAAIGSKLSTNEFPLMNSLTQKRKRMNSTPFTPKRLRTDVRITAQKAALNDRKLTSGTNNIINHGLGSPVKLNSRSTQLNVSKKLTKFIYVSRLKPNVTDELISSYIIGRKPDLSDKDFALRLLVKKDQKLDDLSFISYRLSCTPEMFDTFIDPSFWPSHVMIGEFFERQREMELGSFLSSTQPILKQTSSQSSTEMSTQSPTKTSEQIQIQTSPMDIASTTNLVNQ